MGVFHSSKSPDDLEDEINDIDEQINKLLFQMSEIECDIDILENRKAQLQEEWDMIDDMINEMEDEA